MLPAGAKVLIFGRKGKFFDVKYQKMRGWGLITAFSAGSVSKAPAKAKKVKKARSSSTITDATELPVRINPYLSFAIAGKSSDNQMRLGLMTTYALTDQIAVGATLDMVFLRGTYVGFGPTFRHLWETQSSVINPSLDISTMYYGLKREGQGDKGFGFQIGVENSSYIFQSQSFQPSITVRGGFDTLFFGFEQVRIPFFIALGTGFRF